MTCVNYNYIVAEVPFNTKDEQKKMYRDNMPENRPRKEKTKEISFLQEFCQTVEVIIQTVNENEYQAATTFLTAPNEMFSRAVVFPMTSMVVGMFADKKTALIQTDVGENAGTMIEKAIDAFPQAVYVIGVGVCFAFDKSKYQLGDVIVSKQISTFANMAVESTRLENRGEIVAVSDELQRIFCRNLVQNPEFPVCKTRTSEVYSGTIISYPILQKNEQLRDMFHDEVRTAIGGEMEGGQLLKFVKLRKIQGIIAIKGIVDYADSDKAKEWQFISARAALHYTESKLLCEQSFLAEGM